MRRIALALSSALVLAAALSPRPALADDSPKVQDIRKLLELTGAAALGQQVMAQLIPSFKASMPSVPDKFWQDFQKEVRPQELVDMTVPIYDKYLTHDEVKQLIKFYQSPIGKKLVQVMPQITQESMVVGQSWGRALGERVARKLQEEQSKQGK